MKDRLLVAAGALALFTLGLGPSGSSRGDDKASKDIVETAIQAGQFNTLVKALKAADLLETLKGEGPFTLFAPTDEAFAKVPKDKLEALLKDKKALTDVLTYHVQRSKILFAGLGPFNLIRPQVGKGITITVENGKFKVDGANVVKTDIICRNGVIHVIDSVLLPPAN